MKMNVGTGIWAAVFLATVAAPMAMAKEDKYPAADFKPEVVYRNADLITHSSAPSAASSATATAHDPRYPAADFTPVVIQKAVVAEAPHAPDPKYPAAYFNPTVIVPAK